MAHADKVRNLVTALAVGAVLGSAAWSCGLVSRPALCQACNRSIHANMRTVGLVGANRSTFCCPACAIAAFSQSRQPFRIAQLTDFDSSRALDPGRAFVVEGSDLTPCIHSHGQRSPDGQSLALTYDRCSPSIIAFADRNRAQAFAAAYGGRVRAGSSLSGAH